MTRRTLTDAERIVGLREVIEAARGDWHEATALLSVCADLHWLLARSESPSPEGLMEALRPWLRHKDWCNVKTDDPPDTERCKCGLRAALVR